MTIREISFHTQPYRLYEAACIRCGESVASFTNPDYLTEAIEYGHGVLVVSKRCVEDCVVACESCADKCLCAKCGALLENDICPDCHIPQDVTEFIEQYPGDELEGMSVYACAVAVDIGNDEHVALGETSMHVWNRITELRYPICGIVYAGPDRNTAIQRAEEWNRMHHKTPADRIRRTVVT